MAAAFGSETVLAALYLRGGPRVAALPRRRWPAVLDCFEGFGSFGVAEARDRLRAGGCYEESVALAETVTWAHEQVLAGRCLTAACAAYPGGWRLKLGGLAPPALWCAGPPPAVGPYAAVVGSRRLSPALRRFAWQAGGELTRAGRSLVSGAAEGTDRAAVQGYLAAGGSAPVEILPFGLPARSPSGRTWLSVCAPGEPFSTGAAMERNVLIYAWADHALAVAPRYRAGGTWHGGCEALRRRLCALAVHGDAEDPAVQAWSALGVPFVGGVEAWGRHLSVPPPEPAQPELFGAGGVAESRAGYAA